MLTEQMIQEYYLDTTNDLKIRNELIVESRYIIYTVAHWFSSGNKTLYDDLVSLGHYSLIQYVIKLKEGKINTPMESYKIGAYYYLKQTACRHLESLKKRSNGIKLEQVHNKNATFQDIDVDSITDTKTRYISTNVIDAYKKLKTLVSKKELEIITMRYQGYNQNEIAKTLHCTRQNISRILITLKQKTQLKEIF